jgi:hypothetical protein
MWQAQLKSQNDDRTQHYTLLAGNVALTYAEVLRLWKESDAFCSYFSQLLADSPWPAYRWETPPVNSGSIDRNFEFVLLRSDSLERPEDTEAFAEHFNGSSDMETFSNLSGDAVMVVPCPVAKDARYGHLASFLRTAPAEQWQHLWQAVARAMELRIGDRPVWLSTAGMGVSWLHVRLDDRPKYYGYSPFKQIT